MTAASSDAADGGWSNVAVVTVGGAETFVELPGHHVEAASEQAAAILGSIGVMRGDVLALIDRGQDTPLLAPFAMAAESMGAGYVGADRTRFARANLVAFFERFDFRAVFGLFGDIVETLHDQGVTVDELFRGAEIYATPEAARLIGVDDRVRGWTYLGPLAAVGCSGGTGLHVVKGDAELSVEDGELIVHLGQSRVPTGWFGVVDDERCGCSLDLPVVRPSGSEER